MPSRHGRTLSRRYSLIAAASTVPLFLVILALAIFQFSAAREQLLAELEEQVIEHNILLNNILKTVQDYVRTTTAWGGIHLSEHHGTAEASNPGAPLASAGGLLIERNDPSGAGLGSDRRQLARDLGHHMRLAHETMPYLRRSYFFGADRNLLGVVPLRGDLGGEFRGAPDAEILDRIATFPPFADGLGAGAGAAADGRPYWTSAYLDPLGDGWVVAHASPLRADGGLVGVVGTSVLLDFLTSFLRAFDYPGGRLWLVNREQQVLAASDGRTIAGLELLGFGEVAPADLQVTDFDQLTVPSRSFRDYDGNHVLAQRVGSTPWTLLFVVTSAELNAVILPRLIPYGIILAGLVVTACLAQLLRQRLVFRPALAFADYVKQQANHQNLPSPHLPRLWQPLVEATGDAFRAQRDSFIRTQDSEAMKAAIIASAFDAWIVIDADGRVVEFNPSAEEMFGVARDATIGQTLSAVIIPPHLRAAHDRGMRRYLETGQSNVVGRRIELEALRRDGTPFPVEVAISEVRQAGRRLFTAHLRDITERRAMERALRESSDHFKTIAEAHPVPVCIVRLEDRIILHASQAFADLFRVPLADVAGTDNQQFYVDLGDRDCLVAALRRDGSLHGFEVEARRADGELFPAALTSRLIEFQGTEAIVSGIQDLTEQKRAAAEIARQREALHQSEKLNALGSLLANVAHELNNPLSVVVGYSTMMRDLAPDEATRQRAVKVHAAAERCARIVKTFLTMARRKPEVAAPVQINQTVQGALEVAGYGLRTADVEVTLDLAPDLPVVMGDHDQLTLILMNLIVNAQHALQTQPRPRQVDITTRRQNGNVVVEVADNGPGVPAAIAERIFEPFFTTKPQGVGTGIGLSVCHGIANDHGGDISVASRITGGALFMLNLPGEDREIEPVPATAIPDQVTGRILVVEDEVEIAQMMAEVLGRDEHEVHIANSGRQALAQLATVPIDLILSDIRMPDMDGPSLYRELVESAPDLARRMVFITGDVLTPETDTFLSETGLPAIEKPVDPYDLRLRVQGYLGAARDPKAPLARIATS